MCGLGLLLAKGMMMKIEDFTKIDRCLLIDNRIIVTGGNEIVEVSVNAIAEKAVKLRFHAEPAVRWYGEGQLTYFELIEVLDYKEVKKDE